MDDIPYIIVDNQRIPPIRPSSRSARTADEPPFREEETFGIVDRVTLSPEGREKSRSQRAFGDSDATQLEGAASTTRPALLTYSPKMLR